MTDQQTKAAGEALAGRLARPIMAEHAAGPAGVWTILLTADLRPGAFEVDVEAFLDGDGSLLVYDKLFEDEAYPGWVRTAEDRRAVVEAAAERLRETTGLPVSVRFL